MKKSFVLLIVPALFFAMNAVAVDDGITKLTDYINEALRRIERELIENQKKREAMQRQGNEDFKVSLLGQKLNLLRENSSLLHLLSKVETFIQISEEQIALEDVPKLYDQNRDKQSFLWNSYMTLNGLFNKKATKEEILTYLDRLEKEVTPLITDEIKKNHFLHLIAQAQRGASEGFRKFGPLTGFLVTEVRILDGTSSALSHVMEEGRAFDLEKALIGELYLLIKNDRLAKKNPTLERLLRDNNVSLHLGHGTFNFPKQGELFVRFDDGGKKFLKPWIPFEALSRDLLASKNKDVQNEPISPQLIAETLKMQLQELEKQYNEAITANNQDRLSTVLRTVRTVEQANEELAKLPFNYWLDKWEHVLKELPLRSIRGSR